MAVLGEQKQIIKVVKPTDVQIPTEEQVEETIKNDDRIHQNV